VNLSLGHGAYFTWATFDGELSAAEDSVYGVATASWKVSGHVAATPASGEEPTPDQALWADEMDRAALVHGPFQRLGGNGPALSWGHSQSIGIRCDTTLFAEVADGNETSILQSWPRSVWRSAVSHDAFEQMAGFWCGYAYFAWGGEPA
jgi:hypothetical protein